MNLRLASGRLPHILPADILFLFRMRRVIGADEIDGAVVDTLPQRFHMRRRHPEAQTIGSQLFDVLPRTEEKRPRIDLTAARSPSVLGAAQHVQTFWRGHMHDMQLISHGLLEPKQCRNGCVPDNAVKVTIGFRIRLRTVVAAFPVSPFDLIHQVLVMRMNH